MNHILCRKPVGLVVSCALIAGCGGGGGGSSSPDSYAGLWSGDLFLARNTCAFEVPELLNQVYFVNQSATRVVVNASYATLEGVLEGDSGFIVGQEALRDVRPDGIVCTINSAVRFVGTGGNEADVTREDRLDCQSGADRNTCTVTFVGQMERGGD